jgi:MOB kinase activator 1
MFTSWWDPNSGKTFRPRHGHRPGTRQFTLHQLAERTLGSGNLREAVALPAGEDVNEWIAMKTVDLYNEVELVYSMIGEYCTEECCPIMSAGSKYEYLWADQAHYLTPMKVPAPKYVDLLFGWVQAQLDDDKIFPTQPGAPFPADFYERIQNISKRLFRVYGHIFHAHFERVVELTFDSHLNSCFKHFMYFVLEFELVREEELQPLQKLIDHFLQEDDAKWGKRQPAMHRAQLMKS